MIIIIHQICVSSTSCIHFYEMIHEVAKSLRPLGMLYGSPIDPDNNLKYKFLYGAKPAIETMEGYTQALGKKLLIVLADAEERGEAGSS
jgi:hypothetical protein